MCSPIEGASAADDVALTDDALLGGRLRLLQPVRGHRAGHDALLLAAAARIAERVVDLGAGAGAAGLAYAVRVPAAQVTLVEIDAELAALAGRNARRGGFADRVSAIAGDVVRLARPSGPALPAAGAADLVLMNPPFNDAARHRVSPDARRARAHMETAGQLEDWVLAAHRLLRPGGELALIHRPEGLADILAVLTGRFGAAAIRPVHPRPDAAAIRILVRARKGRRTPPAILPGLMLADAQGRPSTAAERLLRDGEGLDSVFRPATQT